MANHTSKFVNLVTQVKANIKEISVADVAAQLQSGNPGVVIDVREDHEWIMGHVPGALHLGKGIIERDIEKFFPDTETPLMLYCGGGYRSALAANALQQMGYTNVYSVAGGFRAWCDEGYSISKDPD